MTQRMWVLNSSLILIFFAAIAVFDLLYKPAPHIKQLEPRIAIKEQAQKEPLDAAAIEIICKNDLFGTYSAPSVKAPPKQLLKPIPPFQLPLPAPEPFAKKPAFIPPLALTLKGIIIAPNDDQHAAMIEDETKKEGLYHIGDVIKDAQLIKITRNSVILLRVNGQQETLYLRKDDALLALNEEKKWASIIKKIDATNWQIDPEHFKQEVQTLGRFIERMGIIGAAYDHGQEVGIRVGQGDSGNLSSLLGLQSGDIIQKINNTDVSNAKNRIAIFDTITKQPLGSIIKVTIKRDNQALEYNYTLSRLHKALPTIVSDDKTNEQKTSNDFKMSKLQERERQMREFQERHSNTQQKESLEQIRKRLLENLRNRLQNARIR